MHFLPPELHRVHTSLCLLLKRKAGLTPLPLQKAVLTLQPKRLLSPTQMPKTQEILETLLLRHSRLHIK